MKGAIKLYACCLPVRGASRSLICDVQRNNYDIIPNSLYDLLIQYEGHTVEELKSDFSVEEHETIEEYLQFLLDRDYIFFTQTPESFPKLSLDWQSPYTITNAVIDFDSESDHNLQDIVDQLSYLKCQAVEFRFFSEYSFSKIKDFLFITCNTSLRAVNLVIKHVKPITIASIERLFRASTPLTSVTLHSWPLSLLKPTTKLPIYITHENIANDSHCGAISEFHFNVNIPLFTESMHYNNCLNRKIGIDTRGFVKNCPSQERHFGKASDVRLSDVVRNVAFTDVWAISKDNIEVCKDCEFRYICTDCRVFISKPGDLHSKPAKCTYDPYSGMHSQTATAEVLL